MSVPSPVRTYYLASGPIGIPILGALLADPRLSVCGVGTQPDRPAGRRRLPVATPVGAAAEQRGLAVEKVASVNGEQFLKLLSRCEVELLVVASFGQILRKAVLAEPQFGCLNVHASLLPRHRGASPVAAAILAGDRETGVSFMKIDPGLDTGPVYRSLPLAISPEDTAGSLEENLGSLAAAHVADCIWQVAREGLAPTPQPSEGATYAPRLRKEDARIDWGRPAVEIERRVRAFLPWPTAFTTVPVRKGEVRLQIVSAAVREPVGRVGPPGQVIESSLSQWTVACGEGALMVRRVVPAGRREMSAEEFLRGFPVPAGTCLGAGACECDTGGQ